MFTLSDKQRVLNKEADVIVQSASGTERTASADVDLADEIRIAGFGKLNISDIKDMKVIRAVAPVAAETQFTCVAPAGLAVGDAIEVRVFLKTARYQAELKNNFIGATRPVVFSTAPLAATTTTAIRTAITAAWTKYESMYHNSENPITVGNGAASASATQVTVVAGMESVSIVKMELKRQNSGIGSQAGISLVVAGTPVVGTEGQGQGKFLEESVHMGTAANTAVYGVDNDSTAIDTRADYTEVTFELAVAYDEDLGIAAADTNMVGNHRFTVFMNEANMIAADAAISKMAAAAILAAGANAGMTLTDQTATGGMLTNAQEMTETLRISNGNSVDDVAAFIA